MPFVLHRVPTPPAPGAPPSALVRAAAALSAAVLQEQYGHGDFAEDAEATVVRLAGSPYRASDAWVALPDGLEPQRCAPEDAAGVAWLDRGLRDDLHVAELHVQVRPDARRHGLGTALYRAASAHARAHGRSVELGWSFTRGPAPSEDRALHAASGAGAVDRQAPGTRWALRLGFTLEQAERLSVLALDDLADARLAELRAGAARRARGYDVVAWRGPTPGEWAADVAGIFRRMSTDAPSAGLEIGEEDWDEDRVRVRDRASAAKRERWVTSAARDAASGRLVALSELYWHADRPAGVWQEVTLVADEHRGRGLGLLVKAANLDQLREQNPQAERVSTWNAAENGPMLAINDRLGFRTFGYEAAWQRRHGAAAPAASRGAASAG